jgi:hypothetical protein
MNERQKETWAGVLLGLMFLALLGGGLLVLKLTLHPTGYDWQFVNDPGSGTFTDLGTGSCH